MSIESTEPCRRSSAARRSVLIVWLAGLLSVLTVRQSGADSVLVPAGVQAELISKLASYDRNFAPRAGDAVRVLVVTKRGSAKSELSASDIMAGLSGVESIGGLRHEEKVVPFESSDALAAQCRSERIAIVYLTAGFQNELPSLSTSLSGVDVLSIAAVPDYVPQGIVLGFELQSGRPKLVVNLEQARRQNVHFSPDVLRLMRVY